MANKNGESPIRHVGPKFQNHAQFKIISLGIFNNESFTKVGSEETLMLPASGKNSILTLYLIKVFYLRVLKNVVCSVFPMGKNVNYERKH